MEDSCFNDVQESLASFRAAGTAFDGAATWTIDYRKLVDEISIKLRKENALRLANLYELASWYFEFGPSHDPSYALRVLIALEGKGVFAPDNLKGLVDALKNIQREDLCTVVKDFTSKFFPRPPSPP